jgi:hypothetical protein
MVPRPQLDAKAIPEVGAKRFFALAEVTILSYAATMGFFGGISHRGHTGEES